MESENKDVAALVQKITGLHAAISKLPSLSPSPDVDALFTDLVTACVPPSPVDVTKLGPEAQKMREGLIRLCSEAEGKLEAHYSDLLAAFDNPLDHLGIFPYYSNYINLSKLDAHGARGFLYPIVDLEDIDRGGFEVLAVCHPDDDVVNSVIIARKSKDVHGDALKNERGRCARGEPAVQGRGWYACGVVPVVSPPCRFGEGVRGGPQGNSEGPF
ncbi:unnamed protein product [Alopecurus aequalis]